jgi:hypothetical protein
VRLVIDSFGLTPKRPKAGKKVIFKWRQTRAATVSILVAQKRPGRKSGPRCVAGRKKGKRCTAIVKRARQRASGQAGANSVSLSKKLARGSYVATITGPDGASATVAFSVGR